MKAIAPDKKISYAVACFTFVALLCLLLVPGRYVRWITVAVLFVIAAILFIFVKKRSILSYNKKAILIITLVSATLFLALYYLSGIYFGFGSTLIKLNLTMFVTYIIPIVAIILLSEYIRVALVGQGKLIICLIAYIGCVITDVIIAGGVRGISSSYALTDLVGMTLLPAITSNVLYSYIAKRYGALPSIAYRMIITLYIYVIPFVPNAPIILSAFALLILPLIILALIDTMYEKKVRRAREKKSKLGLIIPCLLIVVMASFVMLVSCKFRYGILVIASPSMTGEINVGDAVIYEAYEHCEEAKENDIVVFTTNSNTKVVHRIIQINTINGQKQYITKGDANEDADLGYITDENIIGIVHAKVLYIGYPSLWLYKLFE